MNFDKEIQQAKIAHVEELLREAMNEAKQNGITPICRAYHEWHDGKDMGVLHSGSLPCQAWCVSESQADFSGREQGNLGRVGLLCGWHST